MDEARIKTILAGLGIDRPVVKHEVLADGREILTLLGGDTVTLRPADPEAPAAAAAAAEAPAAAAPVAKTPAVDDRPAGRRRRKNP